VFACGLAAGPITAVVAASAGAQDLAVQTITVTKVVDGTAPAGTVFTVNVSCATGGANQDVKFDATGNPIGSNQVSPGTTGGTGVCTIKETDNGGATSTTYTCQITSGSAGATCGGGGADPALIDFADVPWTATVTVTNTFPPAPPAAEPVAGEPTFTG
jgi:hypothetical protein